MVTMGIAKQDSAPTLIGEPPQSRTRARAATRQLVSKAKS